MLLCYLPSITVNGTTLYQSSLQEVIDTSIFYNDRSLSEVYDDEEYAFVEDVKHYVDPDDVILNVPADGSLLAYSMNNLNVVNRYYSGYGTGDEADFSPILRERLYRYAFDAEVQDAIDYIDADYVLLLKTEYDSFETPYWTGYAMISDDTCGFEVVLRNGEMRLYKIL